MSENKNNNSDNACAQTPTGDNPNCGSTISMISTSVTCYPFHTGGLIELNLVAGNSTVRVLIEQKNIKLRRSTDLKSFEVYDGSTSYGQSITYSYPNIETCEKIMREMAAQIWPE